MGCLFCEDSCKNKNMKSFPNYYNLSRVSSSLIRTIPNSSIDFYSQPTSLID